MLNNNRDYARFISLAACFMLAACSSPDTTLQDLSQKIYQQKTWEEPLPPHEFDSDGCSMWPDNDWVECCVIHDTVYWMGGTRKERKKADKELRQCVSATGHPFISSMMYFGVRAGGVYWLPTSFRWGFGWDFPQSGPQGKKY